MGINLRYWIRRRNRSGGVNRSFDSTPDAIRRSCLTGYKTHNDSDEHQTHGWDNKNILDCARYLSDIHKPVWIRRITGTDHYRQWRIPAPTARFIAALDNGLRKWRFSYHTLGVYKWEQLGIPYALKDIPVPTDDLYTECGGYYLSARLKWFFAPNMSRFILFLYICKRQVINRIKLFIINDEKILLHISVTLYHYYIQDDSSNLFCRKNVFAYRRRCKNQLQRRPNLCHTYRYKDLAVQPLKTMREPFRQEQ